MEMTFVVPADRSPQKLSRFIRSGGRLSCSLWKRIKWNGQVTVNGVPSYSANMPVRSGDRIVCTWQEESDIIPSMGPLHVIYEDEWLVVVDKPAGQIIHPTGRTVCDTLVNAVAGYYKRTGQQTGCHPVYRLDRNTTGLVVVAKSAFVQHHLTAEHDRIRRIYLALTSGIPDLPSGMIDSPIGRKEGSIIEWTVRQDGKEAVTSYHVLQKFTDYALVALHLLTGRTHQIRVHMADMGHPLLGDDLYGGPCRLIGRQALHAAQVSFVHPVTGEKLLFTSPVPEDMAVLTGMVSETVFDRQELKEGGL
jgi:23S rRNA pseudouridine1911/1915/1917 synthase